MPASTDSLSGARSSKDNAAASRLTFQVFPPLHHLTRAFEVLAQSPEHLPELVGPVFAFERFESDSVAPLAYGPEFIRADC